MDRQAAAAHALASDTMWPYGHTAAGPGRELVLQASDLAVGLGFQGV